MQAQEQKGKDDALWVVRYPTQVPPGEAGERRWRIARSRWSQTEKVESRKVRRQLLWILLAIEVGMALVAACILPLVFMNLPTGEGGIVAALLERVGDAGTSPSQILCLGLFLPAPILLLTLGLSIGIYRLYLTGRKG